MERVGPAVYTMLGMGPLHIQIQIESVKVKPNPRPLFVSGFVYHLRTSPPPPPGRIDSLVSEEFLGMLQLLGTWG